MRDRIQDLLLSNWELIEPAARAPKALQFVTSAKKRKTLLFVFTPGGERPVAVVKIARGEPDYVQSEARNLDLLRGFVRDPGDAGRILFPLLTRNIDGQTILLQKFALGRPLLWLNNSRIPEVVSWIQRIHRETASHDDTLVSKIRGQFAAACDKFRDQPAVHRLLIRAVESLCGSGNGQIPAVFAHGDFTEDNVLFEGSTFSVLDWEFSTYPGLPLSDVVMLILRAGNGTPLPALKSLLDAYAGLDSASGPSWNLCRSYLNALEIPESFFVPLTVYSFVDRLGLLARLEIRGEKEKALVDCLHTVAGHQCSGAS